MKQTILYLHGQGGSAAEAEHYRPLFPGGTVTGIDYQAGTPWEAQSELPALFDKLTAPGEETILIANSIGAFFAMHALKDKPISRAYFISPVADMEALIRSMMADADVTEEELRRKGTVKTAGGTDLSWAYLCFVREHPIAWPIPTHVLYGENDALTNLDTMRRFCENIGAELTVMKAGEHWFHTDDQMAFLDFWIIEREKR